MNGIIRIVKSQENSGLLLDGVFEAVKHEIKQQDGEFLGMLLRTLSALMLGNMLTGKWIMRAGKGVMGLGKKYNNIDHLDKVFSAVLSFKQHQNYRLFQLQT